MSEMVIENNATAKTLSWIMFGGEALQVLYDLRWMLVLIVVLVLGDFWFGVSDSIHKKVDFRFSRAGRRTCNKLVDYITYLLVGTLLGLGIFEPLGWTTHTVTAAVGLGFGCVWELDSIMGHVCSLHGVKWNFSIKNFVIAIIKRKSMLVGEAVEEGMRYEHNNELQGKRHPRRED